MQSACDFLIRQMTKIQHLRDIYIYIYIWLRFTAQTVFCFFAITDFLVIFYVFVYA